MSTNFLKYFLIVVVTAVIVGGGTYLLAKSTTDTDSEVATSAKPSTTTSTTAKPSAALRTYTNNTYGIEMQIPGDWTEVNTPESALLTGKDTDNNIQIQLSISKNLTSLSCTQVFKDSEELVYTNPLPGQRQKTNLTFTSIQYTAGQKSTLCSIMVTGSFTAKQGSSIDVSSPTFQSALPTNRISIQVSNIDFTTNFPDAELVFGSTKYAELIAALKSAKVK